MQVRTYELASLNDPRGRTAVTVNRVRVSPGFFETMGIPLTRGRAFTERDDMPAPKVAIINEAAVRKFFP